MNDEVEIIPVMDIMNGQVVHGISGKRDEYKPITSKIVDSAKPSDVAEAFQEIFNVEKAYIADLDAISGRGNNFSEISEIVDSTGLRILLDGGARNTEDVENLLRTGIHKAVVATETIGSVGDLSRIIQTYDKSIIGSLDLMRGKTMSVCAQFSEREPLEVALILEAMGIKSLIVLELSLVGTSAGPMNTGLVQICKETSMEIIAGGGVRSRQDLRDLYTLGANAALVATALHHGMIRT